jgi:hypothetical protein
MPYLNNLKKTALLKGGGSCFHAERAVKIKALRLERFDLVTEQKASQFGCEVV